MPDRGVLYIVWGEKSEPVLERSIQSLKRFYPQMPLHIERIAASEGGLHQKARMGSLTPFATTLYLDADTVVLGNLDYAFERAEEFGLACSICECPWMRRYGSEHGDAIEYNTGVLFFSRAAQAVFDAWQSLAPVVPSSSEWSYLGEPNIGSRYDDQASFAHAIRQCRFNPFVLPLNYNLRPSFHHDIFLPLKIWHDYRDLPEGLAELSEACERGEEPVTYLRLQAG